MLDVAKMVDALLEAVEIPLRKLAQRIAALEARPPAEKGEKGDRGRDGTGLAGATINRDGELVVTLSDGQGLSLGRVDGRDGMGFDDLAVAYDGERTFKFRLRQGDREKEFAFHVPVMIYRGAFREAVAYERGDTVTHAGSLWHCNGPTADRPDEGVEAWTRAVRRGRDGKNGKDGERGEKGDPGAAGRAGRDLTQMAPDGSKW